VRKCEGKLQTAISSNLKKRLSAICFHLVSYAFQAGVDSSQKILTANTVVPFFYCKYLNTLRASSVPSGNPSGARSEEREQKIENCKPKNLF
jgi:hypothetical protein